MKQVRKIKASYRSVTGFISYHNLPLAYESTLERDFLLYHVFRKDVVDIIPQPITISFVKNGRTYSYTPDYFVQFTDDSNLCPLIVEVKYKDEWQANWRNWSNKWKSAMQYCKAEGYRFSIYDESRIRHQALENINFLQSYRNLAVDKSVVSAILKELALHNHLPVKTLLNTFFEDRNHDNAKRTLWHLMSQQLIGFDVWSDLRNENMEVSYVAI